MAFIDEYDMDEVVPPPNVVGAKGNAEVVVGEGFT
jgi:hypothetical protein